MKENIILAAKGDFPLDKMQEFMLMGELALDGTLRPIKGALPIAIQARKEGLKGLILPKENANEAAIVNNLNVYGIENLKEVINFFKYPDTFTPVEVDTRDLFFEQINAFDLSS